MVGGIHLAGASEACVSQTVKELKNLGVTYFNLCHCSLDVCHSSGVWPMCLDTFAAGSAIGSGQEEGGKAYGKPIIHLGPVGMSQDIGAFRELFVAYGERMGKLAAWLA